MDLTIVNEKKDSIEFELRNTTIYHANSLRKILLAEVPTLAIDVVSFKFNTSGILDEIITQRCGLIPLHSHEVHNMVFPEECDCYQGLCPKCAVVLSLDVKADQRIRRVTSADFTTNNSKVYPLPEMKIGIVQLKKDQRISMKCIVRKGIGLSNAKWSPVTVASLNYEDEDLVDDEPTVIKMYFETSGQLEAGEVLGEGIQILKRHMARIFFRMAKENRLKNQPPA